MEKINISLTGERILEEVKSEAFQSGLERCLQLTQETERESSFEVGYCPDIDRFAYPDSISMGTRDEVGKSIVALNTDYIDENTRHRFFEEHGFPFPSTRFREWKEYELANSKGSPLFFISKVMEAEGWMKKNKIGLAEAPANADWAKKLESQLESIGRVYPAIDVHTHPYDKKTCFSGGDLKSLNVLRRLNGQANGKNIVNPVYFVLAAASAGETEYQVLGIYEASARPRPSSSDFDSFSNKIHQSVRFGFLRLGLQPSDIRSKYRCIEGSMKPDGVVDWENPSFKHFFRDYK